MAIKCVWHHHPLQPRSVLSDSQSFCFVCSQPVSGYNYRCPDPDCGFFIHLSCLKLPLESLHPLHQNHPLTLFNNNNSNPDHTPELLCNECETHCSGFTYRCSPCSFTLHLQCALQQRAFTFPIHKHPLKFFPYPFGRFESFCCNICADLGYGFCLACNSCDFVIHVECSMFPVTVKSARHHRHTLSITSVRSVDDGSGEFYCDFVCEGEVDPRGSVYYCFECNYMAHLRCLASAPKPHIEFSYKDVEFSFEYVDKSYDLRLQMVKKEHELKLQMCQTEDSGLTEMRRRFSELQITSTSQLNQLADRSEARSTKGLADGTEARSAGERKTEQAVVLEHFSHQHPLRLKEEISKGIFSCSACSEKVSGLAYSCEQCEYFLHRWCGELPPTIKHPLHPAHNLTLLPSGPLTNSYWPCNACEEPCDEFTFGYYCEPCQFNLHPMCASIPSTLRNGIHQHPLILSRKSPYSVKCKACGNDCSTGTFFECRECHLVLDFKCAVLPHKIKHKCHIDPLALTFVPFEGDDSDEFYCDACEELRDPTKWVYYCARCEFSAHMNCVVSKLLGGFEKPGRGPLNYDHHEHLLSLIMNSPFNPS